MAINKKDLRSVPDMKKMERTGENSFVIHTTGKDKFEGKYDSRKYQIVNGKMRPR